MMDFLRLLIRYTTTIFKETVFRILLILDIIGAVVTYFSIAKVPFWIFLVITLLGLFWAGFKLFIKSSPDIKIKLPNKEDVEFRFAGGHTTLTQYFTISIRSYICNFGIQTGSVDSVKVVSSSINKIDDEYVIQQLSIRIRKAIITSEKVIVYGSMFDKELEFPIILKPDTMKAFYITFQLEFKSYDQKQINNAISWLKEINLIAEYKVTENSGVSKKKVNFVIDTEKLEQVKNDGLKKALELDEYFSKKNNEEDII
ncbi:hypothetical protein QYF50_08495 [Paenibacillus vini]|uniref:hypothetical protein n=1 Tax=Paenibacillus vini TaxID=1476024 RepID=UPI0025B6EB13|nr:hypothetical protein [Paenibacillus vini]MDN4067929.1 hypothetical protein [Paenibacillus vini]